MIRRHAVTCLECAQVSPEIVRHYLEVWPEFPHQELSVHHAICASKKCPEDALKWLVVFQFWSRYQELVSIQDSSGSVPLHLSLEKSSFLATDAIQRFCTAGEILQMLQLRNMRGKTPLHLLLERKLIILPWPRANDCRSMFSCVGDQGQSRSEAIFCGLESLTFRRKPGRDYQAEHCNLVRSGTAASFITTTPDTNQN
jgi:hypothetical protein